jgi:hypothetical protein
VCLSVSELSLNLKVVCLYVVHLPIIVIKLIMIRMFVWMLVCMFAWMLVCMFAYFMS